MNISKPSQHMKSLCKELGPEYRITVIDLSQVIYRDFGNGFDLEVSGVNTASIRKRATLYLWHDKNRIIKIVKSVPQEDIGKWAEWLRQKTESIKPEDFDRYGYLKGEKRTISAEDGADAS
jgi:hypothetical protein